jgi:hypothetical protein
MSKHLKLTIFILFSIFTFNCVVVVRGDDVDETEKVPEEKVINNKKKLKHTFYCSKTVFKR